VAFCENLLATSASAACLAPAPLARSSCSSGSAGRCVQRLRRGGTDGAVVDAARGGGAAARRGRRGGDVVPGASGASVAGGAGIEDGCPSNSETVATERRVRTWSVVDAQPLHALRSSGLLGRCRVPTTKPEANEHVPPDAAAQSATQDAFDLQRIVPQRATGAGCAFFVGLGETLGLLGFIVRACLNVDFGLHVAKKALAGAELTVEERAVDPMRLAQVHPGKAILFLRRNQQTLLQMMVCRLVDSYQTYLAEVIQAALRSRPEILRSREQVTVEQVLRFTSLQDFVDDLAARKAGEISYAGFDGFENWFRDRLGVQLVSSPVERTGVIELVETRNAFVHSQGRIGPRYLKRVESTSLNLGDARTIDVDYFFAAARTVTSSVAHVDGDLASKYSLPLLVVQLGRPPHGKRQANSRARHHSQKSGDHRAAGTRSPRHQ
jgi:hypothetical protein